MLMTAQISLGKAKLPPLMWVLDITVISGDKTFAPTWEILHRYKKSAKTEEDREIYTTAYKAHMRESFKVNRERWDEVYRELQYTDVVFLCYCPAGSFCHRHLLVDIFVAIAKSRGDTLDCRGELTKERLNEFTSARSSEESI